VLRLATAKRGLDLWHRLTGTRRQPPAFLFWRGVSPRQKRKAQPRVDAASLPRECVEPETPKGPGLSSVAAVRREGGQRTQPSV